jgi:hypothetical protein
VTAESVEAETEPGVGAAGSAVMDIMEEYCKQSTRVEVPHIASPEVGPGGGVGRGRQVLVDEEGRRLVMIYHGWEGAPLRSPFIYFFIYFFFLRKRAIALF